MAVLSFIWRAVAAVLGIVLLYVLAAVIGGFIPRNADWREPDEGVELFIRTNGVHADLVLPAQAEGIDWHSLFPPEHIRAPERAQGWIGIGWGQREFYLETERWADLTVRTAARALTGGDPLFHIAHLSRPEPSSRHRPLRLTPDSYRRMAEAIRRDVALDAEGRARPLVGEGYGDHDTFYEAHGRYHAFRTSNQWTADILGQGGVRIGVWTPFDRGIMWRFRTGPDGGTGKAAANGPSRP